MIFSSLDNAKREAAKAALLLVEADMKVGLGTGSTAAHFVALLGQKIKQEGMKVSCVATSEVTEKQALSLGVPLSSLDALGTLDLAVDGTDEVDGQLSLIKGGGGALLREKIVAYAAERFIVIADATKKVDRLGAFPLPVEIVPYAAETTLRAIQRQLETLGYEGKYTLRKCPDGGGVFITDNHNLIVDCALKEICAPLEIAKALKVIPGVVEHGLFLGMAERVFLASSAGVEEFVRP